jgi:hypothetical protein
LSTPFAFAKGFAHLNGAVIIFSSIKLIEGTHYIARCALASRVGNDFLLVGWIVETAQMLLDFGHRRHIAARLATTRLPTGSAT